MLYNTSMSTNLELNKYMKNPSKRWITVQNPNGTSVQTCRPVLSSSRGGEYVQFAGTFYKVDKQNRIKFGVKGRSDLP